MGKDVPIGNLCAYVLLTDIHERCLVLKKDLEHLLNVSKFVRDYFYIDKQGGTIFLNYGHVLRLMHRDVCKILGIINNIRDNMVGENKPLNFSSLFTDQNVIWKSLELFCTDDVIGTPIYNKTNDLFGEVIDVLKKRGRTYLIIKKTDGIIVGISSDYIRIKDGHIVVENFNENEAKGIGKTYKEIDTLFEEFKRVRLYKKMKSFKIEDYLTLVLIIRNILERESSRPFEISLNVLNLALRGIRYSLDQAMRGNFAGHTIEQEPTAYTHRDLYHVIRYLTMYCDLYYRSMINFVRNLFISENLATFFYKLTGVNIKDNVIEIGKNFQNEESRESVKRVVLDRMPYLIVLGDRTSPTLVERYNLISLPIVCAYRPRYWSAVSHEVAHTFVNGLLYVKWAFNDFEEFHKYICETKENLLEGIDLRKFENFMDVLKDITIASRKLERWGVFNPKKGRERWIEQALATEILADIFAFLLSGYTYIQTASDLFAVGKSFPPIKNKIPFLVRLHAIYEFAYRMLKDKENKHSLKTAVECVKNYKENELYNHPFRDALKDDILGEIVKDEWYNVERDFVEWYKKNYIEHYDLIKDVDVSVWVRKICKLGSNIGSRVYDTLKGSKILEDLKNLDFFGWLCKDYYAKHKHNKTKLVFSITLNLILNKIAFDRFEKLRNGFLEDLTIEKETFKLFKYMKSLEWIEREVLENE